MDLYTQCRHLEYGLLITARNNLWYVIIHPCQSYLLEYTSRNSLWSVIIHPCQSYLLEYSNIILMEHKRLETRYSSGTGRKYLQVRQTIHSLVSQGKVRPVAISQRAYHGLMQDCSNSSANALELLQPSTKPSLWALSPNILWGIPQQLDIWAVMICAKLGIGRMIKIIIRAKRILVGMSLLTVCKIGPKL